MRIVKRYEARTDISALVLLASVAGADIFKYWLTMHNTYVYFMSMHNSLGYLNKKVCPLRGHILLCASIVALRAWSYTRRKIVEVILLNSVD